MKSHKHCIIIQVHRVIDKYVLTWKWLDQLDIHRAGSRKLEDRGRGRHPSHEYNTVQICFVVVKEQQSSTTNNIITSDRKKRHKTVTTSIYFFNFIFSTLNTVLFGQVTPKPIQEYHLGPIGLLMDGSGSGISKSG